MKRIIIIFLSLYTTLSLSQEKFSVDVFLDPNITSSESQQGNQQNTINTLVNFSLQLKETNFGHFFIGQSVEYANLPKGEYFRYAIAQLGFSFNRSFIIKNLAASLAINYGITRRWSRGFNNYGATFDFSYRFSDRLKLASLFQIVRRTDIEEPMAGNHIYRCSFFLGFKLDLFRVRNI